MGFWLTFPRVLLARGLDHMAVAAHPDQLGRAVVVELSIMSTAASATEEDWPELEDVAV